MKQSNKLSDFIFTEKSIPDTICDYILKELESNHWEKHQWGSIYGDAVDETEAPKEPDITYSKPLDSILNSFVLQTGNKYQKSIQTNLIIIHLISSFHFQKLDLIVIILIKKWRCTLITLKVCSMDIILAFLCFLLLELLMIITKEVN